MYSTEKEVKTAVKNWHMLGLVDRVRDVWLPFKKNWHMLGLVDRVRDVWLLVVLKTLLSFIGPQLSFLLKAWMTSYLLINESTYK